MRYLYNFLFYLALPFIFIRLLWRSWRLPDYRKRLGERLGFYPVRLEKSIWIHAVSVGETIAAIPLIKALQQRYPYYPFLVTTMTPTGAARVKAALGTSVTHAYIPYDVSFAVNRFLTTFQPQIGMMMETELWPNLLANCRKKDIPVALLNARLSARSARGYRLIAPLTHAMLRNIHTIAAISQADAQRFIDLGMLRDRVTVTGNIKFDLELPPHLFSQGIVLRNELGRERAIWIAASTHEGEEEIILVAHKKIREKNSHALLILVPRHPDRFGAVAKLILQHKLASARRSQHQRCTEETAVYLGDTMGELLLLYAISDIAFVGGSLVSTGGHNMLEPAALAKPIITGPHLFNFAEIAEMLFSAKALTKVNDANELADQLISLFQNTSRRKEMGEKAQKIIEANRGALARQFAMVSAMVESRGSS